MADRVVVGLLVAAATAAAAAACVYFAPVARLATGPRARAAAGAGARSVGAPDYVFVHATDLHVMPHTVGNFAQLVDDVLPRVSPDAVLLTGDLVHGRSRADRINAPNATEWELYRSTSMRSELFGTDRWIEVAGNHDRRNQLGPSAFWANSTSRGTEGFSTRVFRDEGKGTSVAVVALDEHTNFTGRRFLSFLGELAPGPAIAELAAARREADFVIALGHYPLFLTKNARGIVDATADLYLCGHLHDGLGDRLQARWPGGMVELEGIDMGHRGRFRILALSDGALTFSDGTVGEWPVVHMLGEADGAAHFLLFGPHDGLRILAPDGSERRAVVAADSSVWSVDARPGETLRFVRADGATVHTLVAGAPRTGVNGGWIEAAMLMGDFFGALPFVHATFVLCIAALLSRRSRGLALLVAVLVGFGPVAVLEAVDGVWCAVFPQLLVRLDTLEVIWAADALFFVERVVVKRLLLVAPAVGVLPPRIALGVVAAIDAWLFLEFARFYTWAAVLYSPAFLPLSIATLAILLRAPPRP